MGTLSAEQLKTTADKLIKFHHQAEQKNEWTFFVDELYADDSVYTCEYGGTMIVIANGKEEMKATHYGRDMQRGWEGWTFPYQGVYVGEDNKLITHWLNRGPGQKPDASYYETHGISFLEIDDNGKIYRQFDMFDISHQMNLCDQLEEAGLLSAELKENWVIPMKQKIKDLLSI
jgi:ketosteroid isomerase-like protein